MVGIRALGMAVLALALATSEPVSANEAVESMALKIDAPSYNYSVSSQSGWLDQPRTQQSSLGGGLSGVMPVAHEFGVRLNVSGGASRAKSDPAGTISDRDFVGSVGTAISGFWRNSDRYELGLGYAIDFGFNPFTIEDRNQQAGAFGALFISAVDLRMSIDYQRGDRTSEFQILGGPQPTVLTLDSTSNGVNLDTGVTWYAARWLAANLGAFYWHTASDDETPFGSLSMKGDGGGVNVQASVLPPFPHGGFVVLDAWIGYARGRTRPDGPVPSIIQLSSNGTNSYNVGAGLRFVLPGVESLAELRRRY